MAILDPKGGHTSHLLEAVNSWQESNLYQELIWDGTFHDYLKIVEKNPKVCRSALDRKSTRLNSSH